MTLKPEAPPGGGRPSKGNELNKKSQLNFRIALDDKAELIEASANQFKTLDEFIVAPAVKRAREDNLKT